ncbi:MAG: ABC transporter permease [Paracoccaceae bacterium]
MLWETVRLAVQAIFRNTLRSFLTVLGIVIGVAAVIAMVTVGQGSQVQVTSDVQSLGTNTLMVRPGQRGGMQAGSAARPFTVADAAAIQEDLASINIAAPYNTARITAVFGNQNHATQLVGATTPLMEAMNWKIAQGRAFTEAEEKAGRPVCVLGETVRQELLGNIPPLGEAIRLKGLSCEVIGVLEAKGATSFGQDQDDTIAIPLKTYQRRIAGNTDVSIIYVEAMPEVSTARATRDIEALMRERRHIAQGEEDDFSVIDMKQIASILSGITSVLAGLLSSVAAVSLLVGGIGIMNIMLVSVTERTREIGIRLAVGAQAGQVLLQFLVEAIVLSLLGGALGILLGLGLAAVAAQLMSIPFTPDPMVVLIAFAFSAGVGVIFGYFPARRAARMDPIEALRHQ